MLIYTYDKSFDGLMTCIYEAFYSKLQPEDILPKDKFIPNLISEEQYIFTDVLKSQKVKKAIQDKISRTAFHRIYTAHLSESSHHEMSVLHYLILGFKVGKNVDSHMHREFVMDLVKLENKVNLEAHRLLGFLRFSEVSNNLYYSTISPEYNVLQLIAPHFVKRFSNQNFIIHDRLRNLVCIYNCKEFKVLELDEQNSLYLENLRSNNFYEVLWEQYFKATTISERTNLKSQRGHMPQRYWNNMTEFKNFEEPE